MNTHPLIVFSGGMDSSLMLWHALKQGDVHTCYFKGSQHPEKAELELIARQKVIEYFTKLTGNKVISDTIVDFQEIEIETKSLYSTDSQTNYVPNRTWGQAHLWLFGLLYVSDGNKHSKVCIGNLIDDDITMHFENMMKTWEHVQKFTKFISIPLEFPLQHWNKEQVISNLPRDIISSLWVCEMPVVGDETHIRKACGDCMACRTLLKSMWMWEHLNGRNFRKYVEGTEEIAVSLQEV